MKKWITYGASIVLIFLLCLIASYVIDNSLIFPRPLAILSRFMDLLLEKRTYTIIISTLLRLLISLSISFLIGMGLGILAGLVKYVEWLLKPIMTILRTIPLASIILLIIMITGISKSPYIICCLIITPVVYESFLGGIKSIDSSIMDVWKLESSVNALVIRKALIPTILPFISTAFFQSIGLGFKSLVMAEFIAQTKNSIGKELVSASNNIEYGTVMAWTIILVILVLIVEAIPRLHGLFNSKKK